MTDFKIEIPAIHVNLSPVMFHLYATQFYRCKQGFDNDGEFSPVPYFLICRAIELELKAKHLESKSRTEVRNQYGHNIKKSYDNLNTSAKILDVEEYRELERANAMYSKKGFEYINISDALTAFKNFPDLLVLDRIALKLIGNAS